MLFWKLSQSSSDYVFNTSLFHAIMAREIKVEGAGEYELWFGIGRNKIRFSKREFCLVTWLKFGYLSNVINEEYESVDGGIHKRYFNNNPELLVKALHETFMKVEFKNKKDALKMAPWEQLDQSDQQWCAQLQLLLQQDFTSAQIHQLLQHGFDSAQIQHHLFHLFQQDCFQSQHFRPIKVALISRVWIISIVWIIVFWINLF